MLREEICGPRWDGVDLTGRTLTIATVRVVVDGKVVVKDAPGSERPARTLPLDDELGRPSARNGCRMSFERLVRGPAFRS